MLPKGEAVRKGPLGLLRSGKSAVISQTIATHGHPVLLKAK